ncbi:MAG: NAD(+)/NADH kinase [Proteobacteria bacterium]|nr:NAD(+)/NADH kinase [Pseudomonadota bacterium]
MTRRYLIIRNPVSGRVGKGLTRAVAAALGGMGVETEITETGPGTATRQAREGVAAGYDAILVAGGDGTIREVAKGMLGSGVPLGVIPVGTANSLARETDMGPAHSPEALAGVLAAAWTRSVFPGIVTLDGREEIFLEEAGAGIDSLAVEAVTPRLKQIFGPMAYVLKCAQQLFLGPNVDIEVRIGDRRIAAGWFIAARADHYAGWLRLGSGVKLGDDELVFLMVHRSRRLEFVGYLWGLLRGRFGAMEGVTLVRAGEAHISAGDGSPVPVPVQADGDFVGHAPFTIRLADQSIDLIIPAPM